MYFDTSVILSLYVNDSLSKLAVEFYRRIALVTSDKILHKAAIAAEANSTYLLGAVFASFDPLERTSKLAAGSSVTPCRHMPA